MVDLSDTSWMNNLPTYADAAPQSQSNFLAAGLKTGYHEAVGALGSAERAVGAATGWGGLADYGKSVADNQAGLAAATRRDDLEDSWSPTAIGYKLAKAIPGTGAAVAGTMALAPVLPEAAALGLGGAAASTLPRWLIGRGLVSAGESAAIKAGTMTAADAAAAASTRAGTEFVKHAVGAAIPMLPQTIGENADTYAKAHGGELDRGGALASIGMGAVEAPIAGAVPAVAHEAAFTGSLAVKMLKGAGVGAGVAAPQAALQSLMTSTMDPNQTLSERAHNAVQAALGGALVGGALGAGMQPFTKTDPTKLAGDAGSLDQATAALDPDNAAPAAPPPPADVDDAPLAARYPHLEPDAAAAMAAAVARGPTPDANTRDLLTNFSSMDESALRAQANELAKNSNKSDAENTHHALVQDEINARTPPGADPETATLFTPDEMGRRVQAEKDFAEQFAQDNPKLSVGADTLKGVTSEPELINKANSILDAAAENNEKVPADVQLIARKYALDGTPINEKIAAQRAVVDGLWAKASEQQDRNPGMARKAAEQAQNVAQPELDRLRSLKELHDQAELLKTPPAADEVAATEATAASTDEASADAAAPAGPAAANDDRPAAPDKWTDKQKEHWNNLLDIIDAKKDDPAAVAAAQDALTLMQSSDGKRGINGKAGARALMAEHGEDVDAMKSAAPPAQEDVGGISTNVPEDLAAQLAPEPQAENPMIRDGSSLQGVLEKYITKSGSTDAINDSTAGGDVAPLAPANMTHPADYTAEILMNHRVEAQRIAADPRDPDAPAAMAALDAENSGRAKDKNAVADFVNAREARLEAQMPQGPFTGRTNNVVGTASVDPAHVQLVDGMMQASEMPNIRVMVGDVNDVQGDRGDAHGLNGSYSPARAAGEYFADPANANRNGMMMQFGPNKADFMIFVRPGLSDAMTASVYGEEVGHIAKKVIYNQASDETKAAVNKEYIDDMRKVNPDMTALDLLRLTRSKAQADEAARTLDPNMKAADLPNLGYYTSFDEWLSNRVSRWLNTAEKPKNAVQRFFASVAERWKNITAAIFGDEYAPGKAVDAMMNAHNVDASMMWAGDGDGRAQFSTATADAAPATPQAMESTVSTRVKGASRYFDALMNSSALSPVITAMRNTKNFFAGSTLNAKLYEQPVPAFRDIVDVSQARGTHQAAFSQPGATLIRQLSKLPTGVQDIMGRLNRFSTEGGDYTLSAQQQPPELASRYAQAAADWKTLNKQYPDAAALMTQLHAATDGARYANRLVELEKVVQTRQARGETIPGAESILAGMRDNNAAKADPMLWKQTLADGTEKLRGVLKDYLDETHKAADQLDELPPTTPTGENEKAAGAVLRQRAADIEAALSRDEDAASRMGRIFTPPGRNGDYVVAGTMPVDPTTGRPSAATADAFEAHLKAAGFDNVAITSTAKDGSFIIRVENEGLMNKLYKSVQDAADKGVVSKDADIRVGKPDDLRALMNTIPKEVQDAIHERNNVSAPDGASDQVRSAYQAAMDNAKMDETRQWLNAQQDAGTTFGSQNGLSTDYWRNYSSYFDSQSRTVASSISSPNMQKALRDLGHQVDAATTNPENAKYALGIQNAAQEAMLREKMKAWSLPSNNWDFVTRLQHAVVIGMSPAYVLTLMGQIATLSWPELAKTHGYMGAALALARAAPDTFKILRSAFNGPHLEITAEGLAKAGVNPELAAKVLRYDNMGLLTQSTWTHQLNNVVGGGNPKWNTIRDMSTVMGRAAEVLPRILTAVAADDLHTSKPVLDANKVPIDRDDFVKRMVNGSQFEWGEGTSSRAVGRMGMFGAMSPLMLNFTGFQSRMIQKFYEEMHALFTGKQNAIDPTKNVRMEAAKFLGGHIAATVVLAGSMGMPGAGWFSAAADGLSNLLTGRDDFDIKSSYRQFLTNTFGADAGEVLAHGLPRAAGIDMSHEGENELLPFTRFFEDKHKFTDALKDWAESMAGSGVGMAANAYASGHDLYNGDIGLAAQKFLPGSLLKGSMQAFRIGATGQYQDKNGVPLPLTPGASDILLTALGLKPTAKAEYDEEQNAIVGLEAKRTQHAQDISSHIERAVLNNDPDMLAKWNAESDNYAMQHPGLTPPAMSAQRRALSLGMQSANAASTGIHLGQNIRDLGLAEQTRYGNWRRGMPAQ